MRSVAAIEERPPATRDASRLAFQAPLIPIPSRPRLTGWQCVVVLLLLAYGSVLRTWDLGSTPLWVDEAESCINALTILDHGVPVDHYLAQPIYENTLSKPWPESAEYEFKDGSYSDRGLAIYHGWLPLYAVAGSFKAAGIAPDRDPAFVGVRHTPRELRLRTIVGRLPAVAFGLVFLLAAFQGGRALYGTDAGFVALAVGVVCEPAVSFARQARYYAPTLALTTCCCLALWAMSRRGGWRDFLAGGLLLALLFHSHMLSFLVACAAGLLLAPVMWRHQKALAKVAASGAIVAIAVIPWVMLSGFAGAASDLPKARDLLQFPSDYLAYPRKQYLFTILAVLTLAWIGVAGRLRNRLPERLVRPFSEHRRAFLFLAAWAMLGYVAFLMCMPAASYFYRRLTLTVMGPGFLFCVLLFTAAGRTISQRFAAPLATVMFAGALALFGQLALWWYPEPVGRLTTYDVVESLRARPPAPGTRVYATPNDHLTFTFYTGMPVGSVAAVRKSYLDSYSGPLLILEAPRFESLNPAEIRAVAERVGIELTSGQMVAMEPLLRTRLIREELAPRVASVEPAVEPLPAELVSTVIAEQRALTRQKVARVTRNEGNPMFRGFDLPDHGAWWQVFFYRFALPLERIGPRLNYAERTREANVEVTPGCWVFYRCPPRPTAGSAAPSPASGAVGRVPSVDRDPLTVGLN